MTDSLALPQTKKPDVHQDTYSKNVLGFWIYLMTDCLLFGTLFATYAILHNSTFGGPTAQDLFKLPEVIGETSVLLVSTVMCGFATLASCRQKKNQVILFLILTF